MSGDQGSSGQSGFALEVGGDNDPFDINVKVSLDGTAKPAADAGADKGQDKLGTEKDAAEQDQDRDQGDDENLKFGSGGDSDEEDGGDDRTRKNLRASRRHAKALRRSIGRDKVVISTLQRQVVGQSNTINALTKAVLSSQMGAKRSEIQRLRSEKSLARSENNVDREAEIDEAIAKELGEVQAIENSLKELDSYRAVSGPNLMLEDWIEKNGDWYRKPGFEAQTSEAVRISQDLARQGIDQYDPRHYEEINRHMSERFPDLYEDDGQEEDAFEGRERDKRQAKQKPDQRRDKMRGPVGGGNKNGGGGGGGGGRQVPRALVETFRAAGFDVSKPEVQDKMWNRYQETLKSHGI